MEWTNTKKPWSQPSQKTQPTLEDTNTKNLGENQVNKHRRPVPWSLKVASRGAASKIKIYMGQGPDGE